MCFYASRELMQVALSGTSKGLPKTPPQTTTSVPYWCGGAAHLRFSYILPPATWPITLVHLFFASNFTVDVPLNGGGRDVELGNPSLEPFVVTFQLPFSCSNGFKH